MYLLHGDAYVLGQSFWAFFDTSSTLREKLLYHEMKPDKHATIFKKIFLPQPKTMACTTISNSKICG